MSVSVSFFYSFFTHSEILSKHWSCPSISRYFFVLVCVSEAVKVCVARGVSADDLSLASALGHITSTHNTAWRDALPGQWEAAFLIPRREASWMSASVCFVCERECVVCVCVGWMPHILICYTDVTADRRLWFVLYSIVRIHSQTIRSFVPKNFKVVKFSHLERSFVSTWRMAAADTRQILRKYYLWL